MQPAQQGWVEPHSFKRKKHPLKPALWRQAGLSCWSVSSTCYVNRHHICSGRRLDRETHELVECECPCHQQLP